MKVVVKHLDKILKDTNFWISEALYQHILNLANES
jgi:chromate transport protein ChrA